VISALCLAAADVASEADEDGQYNMLEKLWAIEPALLMLTDKEKTIHERRLVSVLKQIHDDLDAAVFEACSSTADVVSREKTMDAVFFANHRALIRSTGSEDPLLFR